MAFKLLYNTGQLKGNIGSHILAVCHLLTYISVQLVAFLAEKKTVAANHARVVSDWLKNLNLSYAIYSYYHFTNLKMFFL